MTTQPTPATAAHGFREAYLDVLELAADLSGLCQAVQTLASAADGSARDNGLVSAAHAARRYSRELHGAVERMGEAALREMGQPS